MINLLKSHLGKTFTRGKDHEFLSIKIMHEEIFRCSASKKLHLEEEIDNFGKAPLKDSASTKTDLFVIGNDKPLED